MSDMRKMARAWCHEHRDCNPGGDLAIADLTRLLTEIDAAAEARGREACAAEERALNGIAVIIENWDEHDRRDPECVWPAFSAIEDIIRARGQRGTP